ncbi:LPS assembly lipoprotein LptE [Winogradskyella sp. 3972H.M.0a.05]|uniref:LptE family protein n=1 Tax=Winogradskyella sp. 3972H.M.0a.05 TaxID=2950277 RepID=UPI00339A1E45
MKRLFYFLAIVFSFILTGCGPYSFTGIGDLNADTFQVNYFQNNAALIEPGLDRDFTLALQDLIQNQTNLSLVNSGGDLIYEGEITEYRISPTTATANNTAAQNRLTISVNVRFFNTKDEEKDFEQRFSFFYDFEGSAQLVGSERDTAFAEIFERLTQDIFNRSLANW